MYICMYVMVHTVSHELFTTYTSADQSFVVMLCQCVVKFIGEIDCGGFGSRWNTRCVVRFTYRIDLNYIELKLSHLILWE